MPCSPLPWSRRRFLVAAATAAAAPAWAQDAAPEKSAPKICLFTKPFQSLGYDELADRVAEMGFDGIEATIRKGGHIEPPAVEDELPKMVEALKKRGLEITVMASSIGAATEAHAEKTLRTAARLGIRRYRLAHLKYDLKISVQKQIQALRPQMLELAALNHEVGIAGLYQNHAGTRYVGAAVWDLHLLLQDIPADRIGVAYDIRHATVEGGTTWPVSLNLMRDRLGAAFVKDFVWRGKTLRNVPLGTGRVDPEFFTMLKAQGFKGPYSLHEEYIDHRDPANVPKHLAAIRKDLARLRAMLAEA